MGWRSLKVIESGTIWKPGYGFLFAFHSNYGLFATRESVDVSHVTVQYLKYAPSHFVLTLLAAMVSVTVESTNDARLTDTGSVGYALTAVKMHCTWRLVFVLWTTFGCKRLSVGVVIQFAFIEIFTSSRVYATYQSTDYIYLSTVYICLSTSLRNAALQVSALGFIMLDIVRPIASDRQSEISYGKLIAWDAAIMLWSDQYVFLK